MDDLSTEIKEIMEIYLEDILQKRDPKMNQVVRKRIQDAAYTAARKEIHNYYGF